MAEVASAYVSLLPSAKGFGSKLSSQVGGEVDSAGKKLGSRLGTALKAGALAGGAVAGAFLASTVGAASDAQQAVGGVEAVFGKYADTVLRDSKRAAQGLGLSATAYSELITVSGAMLKNKGLSDFADRSRDLIKVGADLSAMFGGTTKDAVDALNAAMRGESDPIERYGISLNETAVKAELAANGQDKLTGAALEQAKTQARLALIMRQSADAQGAFGRESDTLAGQQQRLGAQFDNIKVTVGTQLLPALTSVASFVNTTALPAFAQFGAKISLVAGFVNRHRVAITALATAIAAVVTITKIHSAVLAVQAAGGLLAALKATKLVTTATKAYTAVQWLLNAALTANPIGIVIVALAALGAGLVIAYKKSETFRNIVNNAFEAVRSGAQSVANFVTKTIPAAFTTVVTFVRGVPGKISAIMNGLASAMYAAGGKLMAMLAAGIKAAALAPYNELKAIAAKLKGLLPGSPIKWGPLKNWNNGGAGRRLMELVERGITQATPRTVKAAQSAFEKIGDALREERDRLQGVLDGLLSDFAAIKDAVSGAFTGGLFNVSATVADKETGAAAKTVGQNFIDGLMGKKAELTNLLASFDTLRGWGISPAFLTQLFSSGNGALITELAGMGQAGAMNAANLFGDVTNLGQQLGGAVAQNDPVATRIDETNRQLTQMNQAISYLADDIGDRLNAASKRARQKSKKGGKQK